MCRGSDQHQTGLLQVTDSHLICRRGTLEVCTTHLTIPTLQAAQVSPASAKQAAAGLPQLQSVPQQLAILARCLVFRQLLSKVCPAPHKLQEWAVEPED